VNEAFRQLGLLSWKPVVSALVLPPMPALLLMAIGFAVRPRRRTVGWVVFCLGAALAWMSSTQVFAAWTEHWLLSPPAPLSAQDIAGLKREVASGRRIAIVALGGGRAAGIEYGQPALAGRSLPRLHYAVWLSRQTGAPILFSGGVGYGQTDSMPEARIAVVVAERDYGRPLRWAEDESRDTRENASHSLAMLKPHGIEQVVLVTDSWHMPRSLRAFEQAAERQGIPRIRPAPMGQASNEDRIVLRWMPSTDGFTRVHSIWRERLGLWMGA
jgi:uncharacterized SAM-binding protein YcdF (DUF218 family)